MIVERIIFNILAFGLFSIIFLKMIQRNDTNYTYVLIAQAIGIAIGFIGLVFRIDLPVIIIILTYIISVLIPIAVVICEKKGLFFSEVIYISMAKFYFNKENDQKAKQVLTNIVEKYPNSYYIHKELAAIYEKMGNKDIAIDEYVRASDLKPLDYNLKIKIADLLKDTQRSQEAIGMLNDILRKKPECYEASIILGDILYEKESYKEAINIYLQALSYNPEQYDLYYNLAIAFTAVNDFQSAKEYFEKAAELNSILYNAKFNLGQIALLYNDLEESEEYFEECINDEDIADEVYYYLAYISTLKGEREDAIQYLNTAVEENKKLYEKANKEPVFRLIIKEVKKPTNNAEIKRNITAKERKTMQHLEETCAVVGSLNHNDVKAIRLLREREKEDKQKEKERE